MTTPAGVAYAPRFARECTRSARIRPSSSSASVALLVEVAAVRRRQEFLDALGASTSPDASSLRAQHAATTSSA